MKLDKPDYQQYRRYYQVISEMGKRPQTHLYTMVAFTFLAVSLFAWYAIRPTLQTILYLRREIDDKIGVNQKMEEKITALIEAQGALSEIETSLPLLTEALPDTPDAIYLMSQLNALARITQASISSIRTSDVSVLGQSASESATQKTEGVSEISFNLTLVGSYDALVAFLNGMIDMRRIVSIDSINFSQNGQQQDSSTDQPLQIVARVRSYYMPEASNGQ